MVPLPDLPNEIIEKIFLHLPPDVPASLVRASLTNRHWLTLLTGDRFRGEYLKLHGTPPWLGFFITRPKVSPQPFVPAESAQGFFKSRTDLAATKVDYNVWDCRHGRVLLCNWDVLVAWDPMTGSQAMLLLVPDDFSNLVAVVVCNVTGCNHSACNEGPFRVFWVGVRNLTDGTCGVRAYSYSLSKMAKIESSVRAELELSAHTKEATLSYKPPVYVQEDAFYCMLVYSDRSLHILKCDFDLADPNWEDHLSVFDVPPSVQNLKTASVKHAILMAMQDGALGLAHLDGSTVNLWERKMGSDEVISWTQSKSIDLIRTLTAIKNPNDIHLLKGSVDGTDAIFFTTNLGTYVINLKSLRWRKISKIKLDGLFAGLVPYMSFYHLRGLEKGPDKEILEQGCAASASK